MSRLRVESFSISIDGYGAGTNQSVEEPLGVGGEPLHEWLVATRTFHRMCGKEGGSADIDDGFAQRGFDNVGAWILRRNMFGPVRGSGEALLAGIDLPALGYRCSEHVATARASHVVITRTKEPK